MSGVLAAMMAAVAAWCWSPPPAPALGEVGQAPSRRATWLPPALLVVACLTLGAGLGGLRGILWATIASAVLGTALLLGMRAVQTRNRHRAATEVAHATQVLAGQLRLGAVPSVALASAAKDSPCMERPAAVHAIGGDVARALRESGETPGRQGMVSLARAWELSERTGAPIAAVCAQTSDQVRRDAATRRAVESELAGPRASAKLLALLPLFGIAMGRMSGGDPVGFLTGTVPGLACLTFGAILACVGVLWIESMATRAQGPAR